jgi:hypothetical protein
MLQDDQHVILSLYNLAWPRNSGMFGLWQCRDSYESHFVLYKMEHMARAMLPYTVASLAGRHICGDASNATRTGRTGDPVGQITSK